MAGQPRQLRELSPEFIARTMASPAVRTALAAKAARVLPAAQTSARAAGAPAFAEALKITTGIRPGTLARNGLKRPYARIGATITPEISAADVRATLTHRLILRRATRA